MKLLVCLAAAAAVFGQAPEVKKFEVRIDGPGPKEDVLFFRGGPTIAGMPGAEAIGMMRTEMMGPMGTVKGAPYSAEIISEDTQVLGDGNRIVNKSTQSFFRDSEGRTRREINGDVIMIDDPVASVHYMLNPKAKTAHKVALPKFPEGAIGASNVRVMTGAPTDGKKTVMVTQRVLAGPGAEEPGTVEQLGKQSMEGLAVTGTRRTVNIPAGKIGNDRPINSVFESWVSDELKTTIYSKRTDPRFGDSVNRTTNVRRGEQPRSLFEVPGDYKLEEGPSGPGFRMILDRKGPNTPELF
jgi:hypothetical protein